MPSTSLTRRQQEVLQFILAFRAEHGHSPTLEEMARHFGLSRTSIHEHCDQLIAKGRLSRAGEHTARNLEPADDPCVLRSSAKRVVDEEFTTGEKKGASPDEVKTAIHTGLDQLPVR
jgi:SOS-response transcriptional repressor LexA